MTLSNPWFLAAIVGILGWFHLELVAEFLNLSRLRRDVPEPMRDLVTEEDQERAMEYHIKGTKLDVIQSTVSLAALLTFWFLGGFHWLDGKAGSAGFGPYRQRPVVDHRACRRADVSLTALRLDWHLRHRDRVRFQQDHPAHVHC